MCVFPNRNFDFFFFKKWIKYKNALMYIHFLHYKYNARMMKMETNNNNVRFEF